MDDCYYCKESIEIESGIDGSCPKCNKVYFWGDYVDENDNIHDSTVLDWE